MSGKEIRETVGLLAVVGSMVFVGLEIRQNTVAARAAAYQDMGSVISGLWLNAGLNPEVASVLMRFIEDGSGEFSQMEDDVLVMTAVGALRQFEATWRQVELGLLGPEALEMFGWNNQAPAWLANFRRLWPRIGPNMSPDFAEYMEGNLGITR